MFSFYHSFQGILRVHFGEIGQLNTLVVHYATLSRLSQPQAQLDLLIDCYLWAFHLYRQERVHIQHCWVILTSFAWVRFAVVISDCTRKGQNPNREPSRCKTKNTKPHNAYDVVKYAKDFEKGNTIMKNYGDPQSQMCHIDGFLSEVYDDARLLNLAIGKPKPGNLTQIHDEVMKKLECMAHAWWCNAHIGGYPIPFCCEPATLCKMYTMEELQAVSIVTTMTTSADSVTSKWPAGSEFEESDITDTEGLCKVVEESTDTEMVCQTHTTLMITSDREKVPLKALVKEQDHAINEAVRQVQEKHLEEVQAIMDAAQCREDGRSCHKHCSASWEEDVKRSHEESPEYGTTPQERGRSLHHKSKSDLQFPASPGRRHPGSQSFTWSRPHLNSRSSTPSQSHCRDYTLHTSRKWPVTKPLRLTEVTPTRSLAQKTLKLKSIVQRVPATKNYWDPPYKSLETDPKEFIRYLMGIGNLDRKAYDTEIRSLTTFYSQSTVIAHRVIASTITTLVVAHRGVHFLAPFIPRELMNLLANPPDCKTTGTSHPQWGLPDGCQSPLCQGMDICDAPPAILAWRQLCLHLRGSRPAREQAYALCLLQDQCHVKPVRHFHIAARGHGPHTVACIQPEQCIADYESHLHVIKEMEILWNWLRNCYLGEATVEQRHLQLHGGSLNRLPFLHSYEDQGQFYHSRGIRPNEVKPTPENAPRVANTMLEALAHHNHWQSEARDHQEYQRQQDNTESLIANFPSPTPVDHDEPMDLEDLESATAAPSPSSSATTVPPPSSFTVSAPAKKKISIQEYNCCKATEQQWASTYLNRDENGEDLDYKDFDPQDDPADFQIGYRTPMPVPQIPDLPLLQDASSPASQSAATPVAPNVTIPMPQGNTSPGTIPGTTVHNVATTAN